MKYLKGYNIQNNHFEIEIACLIISIYFAQFWHRESWPTKILYALNNCQVWVSTSKLKKPLGYTNARLQKFSHEGTVCATFLCEKDGRNYKKRPKTTSLWM